MRILILEDNPERIELFIQNFNNCELIILEDSKEAIDKLKNEDWDILCLDHDLGGEVMVDSGENTGYEVAVWLEENQDRMPQCVLLHSMNPIGRANMKAALPNAYEMPFLWNYTLEDLIK